MPILVKRNICKKGADNRGGRYRTVEVGAGRDPGIRWRDLPSSSLLGASHHRPTPEITASTPAAIFRQISISPWRKVYELLLKPIPHTTISMASTLIIKAHFNFYQKTLYSGRKLWHQHLLVHFGIRFQFLPLGSVKIKILGMAAWNTIHLSHQHSHPGLR